MSLFKFKSGSFLDKLTHSPTVRTVYKTAAGAAGATLGIPPAVTAMAVDTEFNLAFGKVKNPAAGSAAKTTELSVTDVMKAAYDSQPGVATGRNTVNNRPGVNSGENPIVDENGNPIVDENGNPIVDENGNPIPQKKNNTMLYVGAAVVVVIIIIAVFIANKKK